MVNGGTFGTVAAAAADNKGALKYSVTDNGDGTLTFKTTHYSDGTAWKELEDGLPVSDVLDANLKDSGIDVTATVTTADTVAGGTNGLKGSANIQGADTQIPQKAKDTQFGHATVTLDITKLTDGMEITIAG